MERLFKELADILEVDTVTKDNKLEDFDEWDSLGVLTTISMIDEVFNVTITNEEIKKLETIGDLEQLVSSKIK